MGAALTPPLAIAGVQAFALAGVAGLLLHLPAGDWSPIVGYPACSLGVAFVLVNHALAAWLHGLGRTISVVLATVAAATGLISAVPTVFELDQRRGSRSRRPCGAFARSSPARSGGGGAVAMLLVWVLLGSSASFLAVA